MRTIEEVKGFCRVDDITGCWVWAGAIDRGVPKIYAPDWSAHNGAMKTQTGQRAVWHITNRRFIPKGWRVYSTCRTACCLNPQHLKAASNAQWGRDRAATGELKGNIKVRTHVRKLGQARSELTHETYIEVMTSTEKGVDIAKRLGITESTVSKARTGVLVCFQPLSGMFTQLVGGARA